MDTPIIVSIVMAVVGMIFSVTVHEWAHAVVADRLGDPNPRREERLTLNPTTHLDVLGTLLWPALGASLGSGLFGWGRRVEWDERRFRRDVNGVKGAVMTALAGPFANLVMAVLCAVMMKAVLIISGQPLQAQTGTLHAIVLFMQVLLPMNLLLCLFNLLPVAPMLDGFTVLAAVVGHDHPVIRAMLANQLLIFVAIVFFGGRVLVGPLTALYAAILSMVGII
ncbi:MAG: site-2 protease family protein [Myxococcales bacterium]|jgi:Zn-dependent protease|nr:site-2 protease family protein [Myxococcales bacterium]